MESLNFGKCYGDDSGNCCGKCHYNPVIVMATHKRIEITTINIELLLKQNCKVVLVVSDREELMHFTRSFPVNKVLVYAVSNNPLGAKWQCGVNYAKQLLPNPLIIVGSDDVLAPNYISRALDYFNRGAGLVGTTQWFTYDVNHDNLYKMRYVNQNVNFPIGSGKAYSKELLEKISYKIFDPRLNKKLDDLGYINTKRAGAKIFIADDLKVLAVKGGWKEMNSVNAYLHSKNIKSELVDKEILKTIFNYVPS